MSFDEGSDSELRKTSQSAESKDAVEYKDAPEKVELRVGDPHTETGNDAQSPETNGGEHASAALPGHEAQHESAALPGHETQHESDATPEGEAQRENDAAPRPVAETSESAERTFVKEPLKSPPTPGIANGGKLPRAVTGVVIFALLVFVLTFGLYVFSVIHDLRNIAGFLTFGLIGVFAAINYIWFCSAIVKVNNYLRTRVPGANLESPLSMLCASTTPVVLLVSVSVFILSSSNRLYFNLPYHNALAVLTLLTLCYWGVVQVRWIWRLSLCFRNCQLQRQQKILTKSGRNTLKLQERLVLFFQRWKVLFSTVLLYLTFPFFFITAAVYVNSLNDSIHELFGEQRISKAKGPRKEDVPKDKFLVRYRAYAAIELWFRQRFASTGWKNLGLARGMLAFLAAPFLIAGGCYAVGWLVQTFVPSLPGIFSATNSSPMVGSSNITVMVFMACFVVVSIGMVMWRVGSKPSHFEFSPLGFRPVRKSWKRVKEGPLVEWTSIVQVSLESGTKAGDSTIVFHLKDNSKHKLKLSSIESMDDREAILKSIELWAPSLPRTSEVVQALQPPMDHSYTELWLQALAAPPERDRLKPLTAGLALKEQRYKVSRSLGVGGQGSAYEAVDQLTDEVVVLKEFLLPVYVDVSVRKEVLESFENEARLLRQLDHPQVVKLVDFFVEDHRAYLVLEHIEGLSLRDLVDKHGRLPESRVNDLARSMCEILEYLHGREPPVVHRDFTPDNLILRSDGLLKLIDFNVAQQLESGATGSVVGKPAYLPPEQFRGMPVTQSDIYALGATLMFLLTGRDPEPISVSHPKQLDGSLSEEIDSVVARATAEEISKRYSVASQLLSDLQPAQSRGADLRSVIRECTEKVVLMQTEDDDDLATDFGGVSQLSSSADSAPSIVAPAVDSPSSADTNEETDRTAAIRDKPSALISALSRPLAIIERVSQAACCLAIFIGVMALASPSSLLLFDSDREYKSHLLKAADHFDAKKYDLAVEECSKAIENRPNKAKGYWLRGISLVRNSVDLRDPSRFNTARNDFKKMATLKLDEADVFVSLPQVLYLRDYKGVIDLSKKNASPCWYMNLPFLDTMFGMLNDVYIQGAYLHLGKPELALQTLEGIIEKDKNENMLSSSTHGLRAVLNELCHNYSNAQRFLKKTDDSYYRHYGKLTPLDLHKEAMTHAQEFPQDEKSESAVWSLSEGVGYYSIGLYEKSRSALSDLITLKPTFVDGYLWRGDSNLRLSDFEMALADADKSLALSPKSVRAHYIRARALLGLERYEEALKEIDITMSGGEEATPSVRYVRGRILLAQGKVKESLDDFKYAFENGQIYSLKERAAFGEIKALMKLGDLESALKKCDAMIASGNGKLGEARFLQGTIYDAMGKTKEAEESFARAQKLGFDKEAEIKGRTLFIRLDDRTYLAPQAWFLTDI